MEQSASIVSGGGFIIYDAGMPGVIGPTVVNSYTTLAIPAYWRAMNFIANNMASFPRAVCKNDAAVKHAIDPVLKRRPNGFQSASMFWRTLFFHRSHYGNSFAEIAGRDSQARPTSLVNCLPESTTPFWWVDEEGNRQSYYYVGGKQPHIVAGADMIHLSGLSYDGLAGFNPVWLQFEAFERSRTLDRYITRFLVKGTVLRGSVEIPAGVSKDQQAAVVELVKSQFRGPDADRDVIILSDGATLNNKTLSPEQSELVKLAGYTTKQISQITGVPPVFLFDLSEGKYNDSVESSYDMVVRDLFRPLMEQDEDELTLKLLTPSEQDAGLEIKFDARALTRGDSKTLSATAVAEKTAGIITGNEARQRIGEPQSGDPAAGKLSTLGSTTPTTPPPTEKP